MQPEAVATDVRGQSGRQVGWEASAGHTSCWRSLLHPFEPAPHRPTQQPPLTSLTRASTASAARRLPCSCCPASRARCFTSASAASRSQPLAPCGWGEMERMVEHRRGTGRNGAGSSHTPTGDAHPLQHASTPTSHLAVDGRQQRALQPVGRPALHRHLRRAGRRAGQRRRHRRRVLAAALARPRRRAGRGVAHLRLLLPARACGGGRRRQRGGGGRGAGAAWRRGGGPHGGVLGGVRLRQRPVVWRRPLAKRAALQHRCA